MEDIGRDFRDGVNFLLLIGLLEGWAQSHLKTNANTVFIILKGFFVPLYEYDPNPSTPESRLANLDLAFQFLSSAGIKPRNRPADVARGDIKAILRLLYCLFVKYKNGEADSKAASPSKTDEDELGLSRETSQE